MFSTYISSNGSKNSMRWSRITSSHKEILILSLMKPGLVISVVIVYITNLSKVSPSLAPETEDDNHLINFIYEVGSYGKWRAVLLGDNCLDMSYRLATVVSWHVLYINCIPHAPPNCSPWFQICQLILRYFVSREMFPCVETYFLERIIITVFPSFSRVSCDINTGVGRYK